MVAYATQVQYKKGVFIPKEKLDLEDNQTFLITFEVSPPAKKDSIKKYVGWLSLNKKDSKKSYKELVQEGLHDKYGH